MRLNSGKLGGLVAQRVEAVQIAKKNLKRNENCEQPKLHRKHQAPLVDKLAPSEEVASDPRDDKRGRYIEADNRMCQAIGKGRSEDDCHPIRRKEATIDEFVTGRRLHPAVGRENPERR